MNRNKLLKYSIVGISNGLLSLFLAFLAFSFLPPAGPCGLTVSYNTYKNDLILTFSVSYFILLSLVQLLVVEGKSK